MVLTRAMAARLEAEEARNQLSKTIPCIYFKYGAGYCHHENKCYYNHECDTSVMAPVQENCAICYEQPPAYGLLENCAHIFCLECISRWRKHSIYEVEDENTTNQRLCPVCRRISRIILPLNYLPTEEQKAVLMAEKRARCAEQPCKYFQNFLPGKTFTGDPLLFYCPYFNDCPYAHIWNMKRFTFTPAMIATQKEWLESQYDDLWEYLSEPESVNWSDDDDDDEDDEDNEEGVNQEMGEPIEVDSESENEDINRAIRASLADLSAIWGPGSIA